MGYKQIAKFTKNFKLKSFTELCDDIVVFKQQYDANNNLIGLNYSNGESNEWRYNKFGKLIYRSYRHNNLKIKEKIHYYRYNRTPLVVNISKRYKWIDMNNWECFFYTLDGFLSTRIICVKSSIATQIKNTSNAKKIKRLEQKTLETIGKLIKKYK